MSEQRLDYDDPWQATAALLFLMTQWSQSHCARLVPLIVEHLCILEHHASAELSPIMRDVCIGLQDKWLTHRPGNRRDQVEATEGTDLHHSRLLH